MALSGTEIREEVDARKLSLQGEEAWNLMAKAEKIVIAGGRNVEEIVPNAKTKEEVLSKIVGRTGNLRAPSVRKGDVFYVGYNDELYALIASR